MKTIDIFGYSFSAIKLRKLRAALTILGVVIGIAAIVALLSITQGLQATITTQLQQRTINQHINCYSRPKRFSDKPPAAAASGVGGARCRRSEASGLGGSGASSSGFNLYVNYTQQIDALSPDISWLIRCDTADRLR